MTVGPLLGGAVDLVTRGMRNAEVLDAFFIPWISLTRLVLRPSRSLSLLAVSGRKVVPTVEQGRDKHHLNHSDIIHKSVELDCQE